MTKFLLPLLIGFFIDRVLGDPQGVPHPVVLMGKTIDKGEIIIRKRIKNEYNGGAVLVLFVICLFTLGAFSVLKIAEWVSPYFRVAAESILCWQCIAAKGLKEESMKVYYALETQGIHAGRKAVSMIVGRDTEALSEEGVIKAAVETVAENTSDGVIAPLIFMVLGGGVLGFFYKAVNTLDSMIGYKNEQYLNFGHFAAKLDDWVNFIPARVSAVLMILSAYLLKMDGRQAWRIFKRDRFNHASPNSAQTESVCAGALNIQLAGEAWYFGKRYPKPAIGDSNRPVETEDIIRANRLMNCSVWIFILAVAVILIIRWIGYA